MRLPFLRPKPAAEPARAAAQRAVRTRAAASGVGGDDIMVARTQARRRLVGALVLLVVGVVGFPMLFETQPRPLPLDIPIQSPATDGRAPTPAPRPARPSPVISLPSDAGAEVPAADAAAARLPQPAASAVAVAASAPRKAASAPAPVLAQAPAAKPSAAAGAKASAAAPAAAVPPRPAASRAGDVRPAAAPPAAAVPAAAASAAGRYVVQVGAYTDTATLRATRTKVEKLGLKTYTQVIEGDAGKRTRVRLGPFATRAEADAAAARLKAARLPADVLAL
jgi:DedD protein